MPASTTPTLSQVKDVKEKALQLLAKEMGTTTTAPEDQKAQEGEGGVQFRLISFIINLNCIKFITHYLTHSINTHDTIEHTLFNTL